MRSNKLECTTQKKSWKMIQQLIRSKKNVLGVWPYWVFIRRRMKHLPTCSLALDTQVWDSSCSLDLWYFLVVLTAIKTSLRSKEESLDRGPGERVCDGRMKAPSLASWLLRPAPAGLGRSVWRGGGCKEGMSSTRRAQSARESRKQILLVQTWDKCILPVLNRLRRPASPQQQHPSSLHRCGPCANKTTGALH